MDIATIIGWLLSMGAVLLLIGATDQMNLFFGTTTAIVSIIFVLGGTLAGTMGRYSMGHFLSSLRVVAKVFASNTQDSQDLIDEIVEMAGVARKQGVLELEKERYQTIFCPRGYGF